MPVPAEYVYDVMRWVLFRSHEWSDDAVKQVADQVLAFAASEGEPTRSLLERVARSTVEHASLRLRDLADELDTDTGEISALIDDLNERTLEGAAVIDRRNETAVGIHGQTGQVTFVSMRLDLAHRLAGPLRRAGDD